MSRSGVERVWRPVAVVRKNQFLYPGGVEGADLDALNEEKPGPISLRIYCRLPRSPSNGPCNLEAVRALPLVMGMAIVNVCLGLYWSESS